MTTYVALLRGIDVGGKNLIKMPALKTAFEAEGFDDVATYIQSGNVLFASSETRNAALNQPDRGHARGGVRLRADRCDQQPKADAFDRRRRAEGVRQLCGAAAW